AAGRFGAEIATQDYRELLARDDIAIIDVVTRDSDHYAVNQAAIEAGKHVLSEQPVAHDYRDVRQVADLARAKGLKTKVGFTFRYSPAVRYLKDMLTRGDLGAPLIDIGHWFMDSDLTSVVGVMRNFIPERMIAATGKMARTNIDDGDIFIGEF